jgi:hypothetical protein
VCLCSLSASAQSNNLKIYIIRHAEKPKKGDNLNCKGLNRSWQLPKVLDKKVGIPAYTYVPSLKCDSSTKHSRMFQTITPFAAEHNLTINSTYIGKDSTGVAASLKAKQGVVLVVWDHKYISSMVHALGIAQAPKWDDDDYDSIWIITFKDGKPTLTLDKEDLHPADDCKF